MLIRPQEFYLSEIVHGTFLRDACQIVQMSVTRILPKLAVALVTFTIGVSVTAIHWLYLVPVTILPEVAKVDQRYSCFPGLSVRVLKSSSQTEHYGLFKVVGPVAVREEIRVGSRCLPGGLRYSSLRTTGPATNVAEG